MQQAFAGPSGPKRGFGGQPVRSRGGRGQRATGPTFGTRKPSGQPHAPNTKTARGRGNTVGSRGAHTGRGGKEGGDKHFAEPSRGTATQPRTAGAR